MYAYFLLNVDSNIERTYICIHWRNRCAFTVDPVDERQKVANIDVAALVLFETAAF